MFGLERLFGNHQIDGWRDDYTLLAAATLNQVAADLIAGFELEIARVSFMKGLGGYGPFIAKHVVPKVHVVSRPVVERLVEEANVALARIVAHQVHWHDRPAGEPLSDEGGSWRDMALTAGPIAGGGALAAALPAAAVKTTTAFLFITTTTISWPVALVGGSLAGVAIATGLLNAAKLLPNAQGRLRKLVRRQVVAMLIEGSAKHPAVLQQLTEAFERAAGEAKDMA
jgi:hypothetical protein